MTPPSRNVPVGRPLATVAADLPTHLGPTDVRQTEAAFRGAADY